MATSRLKLYNQALLLLGERSLSALTDNNEHRRSLDTAWDSGDIVDRWLSDGLWNFAIRTTERNYDAGIDPDFGYTHGFIKPSDWIRTAGVASDPYFNAPLTRYEDERGRWYSDLQVIYVSYVSNDSSYGNDLALWPEKFTAFCEHDLAWCIRARATSLSDEAERRLFQARDLALREARSSDAMNEPARFPPHGSWSRSRGPRV